MINKRSNKKRHVWLPVPMRVQVARATSSPTSWMLGQWQPWECTGPAALALFLPWGWRWSYQCQSFGPSSQGHCFPVWVPAQWVSQHKVSAHTTTSLCVPQILPGLYLGNFVGKWNPAAAEMFSSWGLGLA